MLKKKKKKNKHDIGVDKRHKRTVLFVPTLKFKKTCE